MKQDYITTTLCNSENQQTSEMCYLRVTDSVQGKMFNRKDLTIAKKEKNSKYRSTKYVVTQQIVGI